MKYYELIEKIQSMDLSKYRRVIIPRKSKLNDQTEDAFIEKATIYFGGKMSISEVYRKFGSKLILPGSE